MTEGLIAGMSVVGEDFKHNVLYVPEVLIAARAMKSGMAVLKPLLTSKDGGSKPKGVLLMGTVRGDLHDIGKNLVGRWTPLEREYIFTYLNTARGGSGKARVLLVDYGNHRRMLADDTEVTLSPESDTGYNLTKSARDRGAQNLEWVDAGDHERTKLHYQLRQVVYRGLSLHDLTRVPGFFGLGMMFLVPLAFWLDWSEVRELRAGRAPPKDRGTWPGSISIA